MPRDLLAEKRQPKDLLAEKRQPKDLLEDRTIEPKEERYRSMFPVQSKIQDVVNEVSAPFERFLNANAFGLGDVENKIIGRKRYEPKTSLGKSAEFVGDIAGSFGNPARVAERIGARILPNMAKRAGIAGTSARMARHFGRGSAFGALLPGDISQRVMSAGVGGISDAAVPALFANPYGAKVKNEVGRRLGETWESVKKKVPFQRVEKLPIVQALRESLAKNPFARGAEREAIETTIKNLDEYPGALSLDDARALEQQLGREAKFANDQGYMARAPKSPELNKTIKTERAKISARNDEIAANAGYPEFEDLSKTYGELAEAYPEKKLHSIVGRGFLHPILGATGYGIKKMYGDNPTIRTLGTALEWYGLPPKVRTALFRKIVDTQAGQVMGKALTASASKLIRD